jgi:hypothetical protein
MNIEHCYKTSSEPPQDFWSKASLADLSPIYWLAQQISAPKRLKSNRTISRSTAGVALSPLSPSALVPPTWALMRRN